MAGSLTVPNHYGTADLTERVDQVRIPGEVARESAMMSPTIPI
jgi:hypothetical protein